MSHTVKTIAVVDNYDSFTWNLVALLKEAGAIVEVIYNDDPACLGIDKTRYSGILLSPGPGTPSTSGLTLEVLRKYSGDIPILGVCLGHQAIGQHFGLEVVKAPAPVHGKASVITHDSKGVFAGLGEEISVIRYHSLVVSEPAEDSPLNVTSRTSDGVIMGFRHRDLPVESVQFHPDSAATQYGGEMIRNWVLGL